MNKFIIFTILISFVVADCTQYSSEFGCGNGTEKCPHFFRNIGDNVDSCIDCSQTNQFDSCGVDPSGNICFSYKSIGKYCVNCSTIINNFCGGHQICIQSSSNSQYSWRLNSMGTYCISCEFPISLYPDYRCHPECIGYSIDSFHSQCEYSESSVIFPITTFALLLLFLIF